MQRPAVMGILNVTPDSFSDGGRFDHTSDAITHGLRLVSEGADIVDVGGESTRPGAIRPGVAEELDRVIPVVTALAQAGVTVSVDTMRAEVAVAAVQAGARIVNDVSGGLADPEMLSAVAGLGSTYVAMHWRAHSAVMTDFTDYGGDVVHQVALELAGRVEAALLAGISPDQLVLDAGIGFAKTAAQNWELLRGAETLAELGYPLLWGLSRKSFLGALLADADGAPRSVDGREAANTALSVLLAETGCWALRVHDVRATTDALLAWAALRHQSGDQPGHHAVRPTHELMQESS